MDSKAKIKDVVERNNLVHIATLGEDGLPHVRGVDYAAGDEEGCIYFLTNRDSRKVAHIRSNNGVGFVIDRDCPSLEQMLGLVYIKGSGTATIVEDPEGLEKVFGLLLLKFPFLKDLSVNPADLVGVRVDFGEIFLTDNTLGFGQTEIVNF